MINVSGDLKWVLKGVLTENSVGERICISCSTNEQQTVAIKNFLLIGENKVNDLCLSSSSLVEIDPNNNSKIRN